MYFDSKNAFLKARKGLFASWYPAHVINWFPSFSNVILVLVLNSLRMKRAVLHC